MNRITVILLAALDAVIALGVGVAIPLVPLTVMWGLQSGLTSDWVPFWRAASDIWLLGHGVDLTVTLDPVLAAAFGLSGSTVFTVTIAALGFAFLTVLFGARTGRRASVTPHRIAAAASGIAVFAVLATLLTLSTHVKPVVPSLLQGALLPAGVFALGVGVGMVWAELRRRSDPARGDVTERTERPSGLGWPVDRWSPASRAVVAAALRGGAAAAMLIIAAAGVVLALLMVLNYARVVGLYQSLQPGILGAAALTLAQLAFVPNAVIWTASWLSGPGFAVGTGSSVDVAQTSLGPLPPVPLFGALPQADPGFGLIAVLIPVLCAVAAGFLLRQRLQRVDAALGTGAGAWGFGRLALVALGSAVVAGSVLALLAWWSGGSLGPGRLQDAGPNALFVGVAVAAEVLVGTAIGLSLRRGEGRASVPVSLRERRMRPADAQPSETARPVTTPTTAGAADRSTAPGSPAPHPGPQRSATRPGSAPLTVQRGTGKKGTVPGAGSVTEALAWLDELDRQREPSGEDPSTGRSAEPPRDAVTEPVPLLPVVGRPKGSEGR